MPKRQLRRTFEDKGFKGRKIYGDRKKRIDEVVGMVELDKEFSTLRLVGPLIAYAQWWLEIKTPQGRRVSIPKVPQAFDHVTGEIDASVDDPYSKIEGARLQVFYLINAIDRAAQENEPRKKSKPTKDEDESGFKDKSSATWTPVRVVRIPPMVASQLQALETRNRWKIKGQVETFDLTHPEYGRDVYLSKDSAAKSPSQMYNLSLADKAPLTDEEMDYLIWDIEGLAGKDGPMEPESIEEARREADGILGREDGGGADDDVDDLADDFLEEDAEDDGDDRLPWDDVDDESDADDEARPRRIKDGDGPSGKAKSKDKSKSGKGKPGKAGGKRPKEGASESPRKPKSGKTSVKSRLKRRKLRSQKQG